MKKIFTLLLLTSFLKFQCQTITVNTSVPKSLIDLGVGVGHNYGIVGAQVIAGYKGTGLMLSSGYYGGLFAYAIGAQVSDKWFYFNVSYGVVGAESSFDSNGLDPIFGTVFMLGGKVNLHRQKLFFLQLGVGYQISSWETPIGESDASGGTFGVGIGYRIPFHKSEKQKSEQP